jgi:ubiquinone/menaquinone biosynthesis C-methylase UbiE
MKDDLLRLAGIDDVAGFYRDRFYTGGVLEAGYFDALFRFDINFARTMWVYDNVRRGSSVLDLGCGEGVLALLKRKDVYLAGLDLSPDLVELARRNGYDTACVAHLTELPFADASFDYVVSLDVFGHVDFADKDAVLTEIKRVLRPDGVTMHGIESLDRNLHPDYATASREQLAQFIAVDGHIGLETDEDIARRFSQFFSSVQSEPRYTLCLSSAEFIKQYDNYGAAFDPDFIDYLKGLSFDERHAFDMAMGYVFGKISDLHLQLPSSGLYLLVKASNVAPEPRRVEGRLQIVQVPARKPPTEIARRGGVGNPLGPQRVQVGLVLAAQLQVFQAGPTTQRIISQIEHVVRFVVRQMHFEQVQPPVDFPGQPQLAHQSVHEANAAAYRPYRPARGARGSSLSPM